MKLCSSGLCNFKFHDRCTIKEERKLSSLIDRALCSNCLTFGEKGNSLQTLVNAAFGLLLPDSRQENGKEETEFSFASSKNYNQQYNAGKPKYQNSRFETQNRKTVTNNNNNNTSFETKTNAFQQEPICNTENKNVQDASRVSKAVSSASIQSKKSATPHPHLHPHPHSHSHSSTPHGSDDHSDDDSCMNTRRGKKHNHQSPALSKLPRNTRACDNCIKGHRKCNLSRPCDRCVQRSVPCSITEKIDKNTKSVAVFFREEN